MSITVREKFSSQAAPDVLAGLRQIAVNQSRQFQAVLDEARRIYIERQQKERPRRHVMTSLASSLDECDTGASLEWFDGPPSSWPDWVAQQSPRHLARQLEATV